jgi:prepilin-type N-terminal cleavage/methylation domain-containing protein
MENIDIKKGQEGFTLIEMLISVFIISFSLVSIFNLNSKYTQQTKQEKEAFVATLLAQEGVEIIKNMRDTNSLSLSCWLKGITEDSDTCEVTWSPPSAPVAHITTCLTNGCEVDYDDNPISTGLYDWGSAFNEVDSDPVGGRYLYLNGGFYSYDTSGEWTPYRRRIIVSYPAASDNDGVNRLDVRVIVYWKGKKTEVRQQIYNWRGE